MSTNSVQLYMSTNSAYKYHMMKGRINMNKYELTEESTDFLGHKPYRIRAMRDFYDVKADDFGSEEALMF